MYTLNEYLPIFVGDGLPEKGWDDGMYCLEADAKSILRTNLTHGFVACFAFMLVDRGWMKIRYNGRSSESRPSLLEDGRVVTDEGKANGRELTLRPNDLYTYSPGLPVTVVATSRDFHGLCLMADEHVTIEAPSVHDLVQLAYMPIVQLHEPKQTLAPDAARHLLTKMREIIRYLHSDHIYKAEVLRMLYSIFLLDLQNAQQRAIRHRQTSQRVEEIFIGFTRLLPRYFVEHHDIAFYADRLHISTVYLSRVVRQVTGRTVVGYINQMLLMEASFLLQTSGLSITQIADRLHFADTPSFSKFFSRLKGVSPKEYRKG